MDNSRSNEIRFSVIIPSYNRSEMLKGAIEALINQEDPGCKYEIIAVDNASIDDTKDVVKKIAAESLVPVIYIFEKRPGSHFARNTGFKEASGEILGLIDDDIFVAKDWVHKMVKAYNNPNVSCAGGKITIKWVNGTPEPILERHRGVIGEIDYGPEFKELQYPKYVNAGNFSIRKDILFKVGGYNPCSAPGDIVLTGDGEVGLCDKVYKAGGRIFWIPDSISWHIQDVKRVNYTYLKNRMKINGRSNAALFYRRTEKDKIKAAKRMLYTIRNLLKLYYRYHVRSVYSKREYVLKRVSQNNYFMYLLHILLNKKLRLLVERDNWLDS